MRAALNFQSLGGSSPVEGAALVQPPDLSAASTAETSEEPQGPYPSGTDPAEPLRLDPIWTRFRPDLVLKSPFAGPNQVEIGSIGVPQMGV